MEGTVKWFNKNKNFGFITPSDGSKDVFVHSSEVKGGDITENDKVTFEIKQGDKGPQAANVSKIGAAAEKPKAAEAKIEAKAEKPEVKVEKKKAPKKKE